MNNRFIQIDDKRKIFYEIDKNNCWNVLIQKGVSFCKRYGYPRIHFAGNTRYVYKVIYIQEKEKIGISDGIVIRHTCDNIKCINPDHLIKGTHKDNVSDRVSRNRSAVGERNGRSKLSESDVLSIFYSKKSNNELARTYDIDRAVIRRIKNKETWKYLLDKI